MKKAMTMALAVAAMAGCTPKAEQKACCGCNPFFTEYATPYGVPPFEQIKIEHYKPAFLQGMEEMKCDIARITDNAEAPTFCNTIAALDEAGALLDKVASVFYGLNSANTSDEMQALSRELSPLLSQHEDDITMNAALFERVKAVYDHRAQAGLNAEQMKLVEKTYENFVEGGANLDSASQVRLRELNSEIAMLQLTFGQNMLKETNAYQLVIDREEDLTGLPADLVAQASEVAEAAQMKGKWVFTLHNPSVMPFLQYADNRELRRQIFEAYTTRGCHGGDNDSRQVCAQLVKARLEKAKLMGYEHYAAFALNTRMAKAEQAVYNLLDQTWSFALKKAQEELSDIQAEIKKDGGQFEAEGWDWRYYAYKAKKAKFQFDENTVRPYLKLESVRDGMFLFAKKLYGISFTAIDSIPLPHPDAQAWACNDADGSSLGVLYLDFFPRASKRGGAWCGQYRPQSYRDGQKVTPVVTIVCNFSKPAAGQPALLTADEASTMFHEFGHALHNLFRDVHYQGVSRVARDFVELPSQINEHWTFQPQMLAEYARHYQTGEVIPTSLVERMNECGKYGQGFATTEYLAASLLDMDFHTLKEVPEHFDVMEFEAQTLGRRGLPRQIPSRYRTTYFNHTMGGGYTAGYYSYLWSEVLDSDAFEAFEETGDIFNREVAERFRRHVLQTGCIQDENEMYLQFRGKKPGIEPMLKNRGLK